MHFQPRRLALATMLLFAGAAGAGEFELISRTGISAPMDSNGNSLAPVGASADGRYALFSSLASNLVAGDSNRSRDLFLYDATLGQTVRVSVGSGGIQADSGSGPVGGISNDGRFVVFDSNAASLGSGGRRHVYLHDRALDTTVALTTHNTGASGDSANPRISADGRYVVFDTDTPFSDEDDNGVRDVYRLDRESNTFTLVSTTNDGRRGNANSVQPQISADGSSVMFVTWASNLVPNDTNNHVDLLLRRLDSGSLQRASITTAGAQYADHPIPANQALSADGRYVLFTVFSAGAADDTNGSADGYRFDSNSGSVMRVTFASDGAQIDGSTWGRAISADGQSVLMQSSALNVMPGLSTTHERQYLRRIGDGVVTPVTFREGAAQSDDTFYDSLMSADASTFFATTPVGVAASDSNSFNDVYRQAGSAQPVQRLSAPVAGYGGPYANGDSGYWLSGYALSGDGRYAVFTSLASNLVVGDLNGRADVFLRDRLLGTTRRLSVKPNGAEAQCISQRPVISANGRYVAFDSCGELGGLKSPTFPAIYRYDRVTSALELVSALPDGSPTYSALSPRISADGERVSFSSCDAALASNGTPGTCDIYVRTPFSGETVRASPRINDQGGSVAWFNHDISANGRYVMYSGDADNLVPGDSNERFDTFVYDLQLQTVERVSVDSQGAQLDDYAAGGGISADGNLIVFESAASNLGAGGSTLNTGIFLRDRAAGTTTLVSRRSDGVALNGGSQNASISADGKYVSFVSNASNSSGPNGDYERAFYYVERPLGQLRRVLRLDDEALFEPPQLSADGRSLIFASADSRLVEDDGNGQFMDVFYRGNLIDLIFRDGLQAVP